MSHKGRCFRDRRRTKMRKLRQMAKKIMEEILRPTKMHIPSVAEIPIPEERVETPPPKVFAKPEKEVSFKRRSW